MLALWRHSAIAAACPATGLRDPSWSRNPALTGRHVPSPLHRRTLCDRQVPAFHVWVIVKADGLPFEPRNPWPDRNIRDGIIARDIVAVAEPPVEHGPEPLGLARIALLRVGARARIEFQEMVNLTKDRPRPAHLPHQPLDHAPFGWKILRPQLARLLGEIEQNGAG